MNYAARARTGAWLPAPTACGTFSHSERGPRVDGKNKYNGSAPSFPLMPQDEEMRTLFPFLARARSDARGQAGFTLAEIAIVPVLIGLLLGMMVLGNGISRNRGSGSSSTSSTG